MKSATSWAALSFWLTAIAVTPAMADLDKMLGMADVAQGERVFKKCAACHTVTQGGKNKSGPNLFGIIGKPVAATEGFKYSKALKEYGGEWTIERLDAFFTKPKAEVKGTRMSFGGLKKPKDRANLIAFLNANSDAPVSFGEPQASSEATETTQEAAATEPPEFGLLLVAPGVENTYYTCAVCHSEMIVAQQGLTRPDWEEMLEWMVEEQGMSEIEEPDLSEILDYLAQNYNTDRPNFPSHQLRSKRQFVAD
jgi:cytochrome c